MRTVSIPIGVGVDGTDGTGKEYTLPTEWQGKIKNFTSVGLLAVVANGNAWQTPVIDAIADYPGAGVDATATHLAFNGVDKLKLGYDLTVTVQIILFATVPEKGEVQGYGDGT